MEFIRCRICGETYLGPQAPLRCAYCGAHDRYVAGPYGFVGEDRDVQPTEMERGDLEAALTLARDNSHYHRALASSAPYERLSSGYRRVSALQQTHARVLAGLLGEIEDAETAGTPPVPADWRAALAESTARARRLAAHYAESMTRATNERVKEVFLALSAVEVDLELLNERASALEAAQSSRREKTAAPIATSATDAATAVANGHASEGSDPASISAGAVVNPAGE